MAPTHVRQIVVASRLQGALDTSRVFRAETVPYDLRANDGEAIVQTLYVSIDAGYRAFLGGGLPQSIPIGDPMRGSGVGIVKEVSGGCDVAVGDYVYYRPGWRDWGVYKAETLKVLQFVHEGVSFFCSEYDTTSSIPPGIELYDYVGLLGSSGLSAYVGLIVVGKIKQGETLLVSSAAGAVGHVVCQLGNIIGARVIAVAGSTEKCQVLEQEFGVHKALNYKLPSFKDDLKAVGGIDVFFDNVGGEILNFALTRMNQFGRIVACGLMSKINGQEAPGLTNHMHLILQSVKLEGFLLVHYAEHFATALDQISKWIVDGKLKRRIVIIEGLDKGPDGFAALFANGPIGKTCIRVA